MRLGAGAGTVAGTRRRRVGEQPAVVSLTHHPRLLPPPPALCPAHENNQEQIPHHLLLMHQRMQPGLAVLAGTPAAALSTTHVGKLTGGLKGECFECRE